ncbi:MAG: hypothetical protein E7523_05085 [Ruminococcaceae bacterium]|nr:hypothetical protein [Oscillospiraceae bacterium]
MSENKNDTLQNEMENLAATFQDEYNKAAVEAEEQPLIQELEDIVEEDEEEDEEETVVPEKKKEKKKKEKKKASSIIGSIISFLLVIVLMFVTAGISFYASSFTDLDSYIYSIKCADSVDNAAAKIEYYNEGLAYLEKDIANMPSVATVYEDEIQRVHELIAACTVETEGYAAAMTYMHANLTEEQIAAPLTAEFKAFMQIAGVFETVAAECVSKVEAAGADADFAAIAASYTTDETLSAAITAVLEHVSKALEAEKSDNIAAAGAAYEAALSGLAEYSTKSQVLTERYVLCIAQTKGYAAALTYATNNLTAEQLAAPVVAEFATFTGVADILADLSTSIYDTAKQKVGESAEAPADFAEEIATLNAPAYVSDEITALYTNVTGGLAGINAGSYASAVEMLTAAADSFAGYGCPSNAVTETVVIATAYANGYAEALSFAKMNIKSAEYTPATEEYTAFLAAADVFATLDSEQYNAVSANVATLTAADEAAIDLSGVVAALDIPEFLHADAQAVLTDLARAIISENNNDSKAALDYYKAVAEKLSAVGQKGSLVIEKIAVLTGKVDDLHAAYVYVSENTDFFNADNEDAQPLTEDFASLMTTLKGAFSADKVNAFIENAKNALATGTADSINIADVVSVSGIDTAVADFYKAYFNPLAEAIAAEKDKNLTLAVAKYQELATLLADDNVALPNALLEGIITCAFNSGDLQTAVTYCTNYVDMETLAASEFKTLCETVQLSDAAMQKASAVMQQAYYSSYYGTVPTFEEVSAQFDALLTEDSNKYDQAFNYYNRYVCEIYFFGDDPESSDRQIEYLEKVRELIPEQIFIYGYTMLQTAIAEGNYEEAKALVDEMLAVNAYDDVALSRLAMLARMEGDLEAAAAHVEKGVAYANESYECERQHIILSMLSGNFADAYDSVVAMYDRGLATMQECETIAVYAALFTDANDEQKAKLDEIVNYIKNDLYGAYGYTYSENTNAIINGTKTATDVFLAEPYELW